MLIWSQLLALRAPLSGGVWVREQRIEEEQAGAGDDGGVGHVEVGPVVGEDVDLNEVDDRAIDDAVVNVADCAARMSARAMVVSVTGCRAQQSDKDGERRGDRECDQRPADEVRRSRVGEEREGRAFVGPVSDAQDARDDGDGSAEGNVRGDPGLGAGGRL